MSELLEFLKNPDELNLEKKDFIAIIEPSSSLLVDLIFEISDNIFIVTKNDELKNIIKAKHKSSPKIKFYENTSDLPDKTFHYILIDLNILKLQPDYLRKEARRISYSPWSEMILSIRENENIGESNINMLLTQLFAGSGYEKQSLEHNKSIITIYYNPPGYTEEEFNTKEINEFVKACENYCKIIENLDKYSTKKFLFEIQKCLTEYYLKGFSLPQSNSSSNTSEIYEKYYKHSLNIFKEAMDAIIKLLGVHDTYWSNFNPYPDDNDTECFKHSLACDLAEIYEDIKYNLLGFGTGNLCDKQKTLWQWKFDWKGHTGNHLTFAFRAIHWKLQELEYEDE